MHKNKGFPFTMDIILTIVLMYVISAVIFATQVGPWEAVRNVGGNGLILLAWLWVVRKIMGDEPIPEIEPIHRPRIELIWAILTLAIAMMLAANSYAGWIEQPSWILPVFMVASVLLLFIVFRYPCRDLGLSWPTRRGWLSLLVVILVNIAAAALFQILPAGEAEPIPQADLSNQISGVWSVLLLIFGLLWRAALPEELLLRITLQPRLAQFVPLGWAILVQSLLFSAGHLPQQLIYYQEPILIAAADLLIVNNGIIGGYLWWRTRSLPLLLLLHLFAYARFGI